MLPSAPNRIPDPIPQWVPGEVCLKCDVCCRFPEKQSPLAPFFTKDEVRSAVRRGVPADRFPSPGGGRITLNPNPSGEGYICPAFDPSGNACQIYSDRPLDCRLFPLALMWDPSRSTVLLGYDRKCPFFTAALFESEPWIHARTVAARLERPEAAASISDYAGLVGDFQEDVMILRSLPEWTRILAGNPPAAVPPTPESLGLTPLLTTDRPLFEEALRFSAPMLSAYSWPALSVWGDFFRTYWAIIDRALCLFSADAEGTFMPLAPIGPPLGEKGIARCFELMDAFNRNPSLSRIENADEEQADTLRRMGYLAGEKEKEYIYDREALDFLAGNRFKSKRWAYNRFERNHPGGLEPLRPADVEECMALYREWKDTAPNSDPTGEERLMREDGETVHRRALNHLFDLGLTGRVVRKAGRIKGYTVGFPFRPDTFCILLEVADRKMTGLSVFLFREFCRELRPYRMIHAMGDSGLLRLGRTKESFRPSHRLISYTVHRPRPNR